MVCGAPLYDNEVEELLDGHDWPEVQQQLQRMHVTAEMKTLYMTDRIWTLHALCTLFSWNK